MLVLLLSLITYISACYPHFSYLDSINSYSNLPVSTLFEPNTRCLLLFSFLIIFGYKRQLAQPSLVFQHTVETGNVQDRAFLPSGTRMSIISSAYHVVNPTGHFPKDKLVWLDNNASKEKTPWRGVEPRSRAHGQLYQ